MKFCSSCGQAVQLRIPEGDNRERFVCEACGMIHYQNPRIIAGCVPLWDDKVLLCRRAIEPRRGFWTLPCGFLENGETLEMGAARETREEAEAEVDLRRLFAVYSIPHINQVYMVFLAQLKAEDGFGAGEETLEARLFARDEIPWDDIAFSAVKFTLERYFSDGVAEHAHLGAFVKTEMGY